MDAADYTIISQETTPLEFPWTMRLIMKVRSWLVVNSDGRVNRRMEQLCDFKVSAATRDGVAARDVTIQPDTGVWVRIFTPHQQTTTTSAPAPADLRQLPVFLYFHGGGFVVGCPDSIFPSAFARYVCKTFQALVVSVDYRKAPEHRYPAAYDDCYAAAQWLTSGALPEADLSRCFLVGESAGGNIVHHVACRLASDEAMRGKLTVLANLMFSPFFGGEERTPAELRLLKVDPFLDYRQCDVGWRDFLPEGATRDHPAANIAGPEAPDLTGLPLAPFLVTVAEYDCLKDWQFRYVMALQRMGQHVHLQLYKGGAHCFHVMPKLAVSALFRADLEHFVHSKLNLPATTNY